MPCLPIKLVDCCRAFQDFEQGQCPASGCQSNFLTATGHFRILSKDNALPLVAFSLTKTVNKEGTEEARQYTEFDLADKLRQRGWVLPAYTMAPDARQVPSALVSRLMSVAINALRERLVYKLKQSG